MTAAPNSTTSAQMNSQMDSLLDELRQLLEKVKDPIEDDWDPMRLSLLIAKLEYPDLDLGHQQKLFQTMVDEIEPLIPRQASLRDQARALVKGFAEKLHFEGDKQNYYNIRNSFVNDLMLRRKGIPISLSLLFMAFARAVGLKAVGISFPGHFLVRMVPTAGHFDGAGSAETAQDWQQSWFIDPFDGGKVMTVRDCEIRLQEWTRGVVPFGPDALKVAHPVEIVSRMLRNLRAIFMEKEDLARLYWVLSALIAVCPQDATDSYHDRGMLYVRMGRFHQASDDFKKFLELSQDATGAQTQHATKRGHVEKMLRFFENQQDALN